jgi:hypothetical protein
MNEFAYTAGQRAVSAEGGGGWAPTAALNHEEREEDHAFGERCGLRERQVHEERCGIHEHTKASCTSEHRLRSGRELMTYAQP